MEDKIIDALLEDELLISYIAKMVARRLPSRRKRQNDLRWCKKVVDMSISDAIEELKIVDILNGQIASLGDIVDQKHDESPQQPGFSETEPTQGHIGSKRRSKKKVVHYEPTLEHALDLAGRCIGTDVATDTVINIPPDIVSFPERSSSSLRATGASLSPGTVDRVATRYSIPAVDDRDRESGSVATDQASLELLPGAVREDTTTSSNDFLSASEDPFAFESSPKGTMDFTKTYRFDGNMLSSVRNWRDGFEEGDGDKFTLASSLESQRLGLQDIEIPSNELDLDLDSNTLSSSHTAAQGGAGYADDGEGEIDGVDSPSPTGSPQSVRRLVQRYSEPEPEDEEAFQRREYSSSIDGENNGENNHHFHQDRNGVSTSDSTLSTTTSAAQLSVLPPLSQIAGLHSLYPHPHADPNPETALLQQHSTIHMNFHRTVADAILRSPNRSPHRTPSHSPTASPHDSPKLRQRKTQAQHVRAEGDTGADGDVGGGDGDGGALLLSQEVGGEAALEGGSRHSTRISCDDLAAPDATALQFHAAAAAGVVHGVGSSSQLTEGGGGGAGKGRHTSGGDDDDDYMIGTDRHTSPEKSIDISDNYEDDFLPMSPMGCVPDTTTTTSSGGRVDRDDDYADEDFDSPTFHASEVPPRESFSTSTDTAAAAGFRVRFIPTIVSKLHYIDKYHRSEVPDLFYTHEESLKFTDDFNRESEKAELKGMTWDQWWELRTDDDVKRDEEEADLDELDYYHPEDQFSDDDEDGYDF